MSTAVTTAGQEDELPDGGRRGRFALRPGPWVWQWSLAVVFFAMYLAISLHRQFRLQSTGFDLGIFEQVVRAYAHFQAPVVPLKGPGYLVLGDHFSPILATLGPFYRLFPSPVTLLVAQALLLAVSIIPVSQLARSVLSERLAAAVTVTYGLSWGLQRVVGFDFHEVAFAVPLMAFTVKALAQQRWRAAAWWALPLILVKEDLPLTVAAVGAYIFLVGRKRLFGAGLAAFGVVVFLVISFVVIPSFNNKHAYAYSSFLPSTFSDVAQGWSTKFGTLLLLAALTVVIGLRSPLLLLAVPTLSWRFVSTNPANWDSVFHYDAILMPIVLGAFITQVARLHDVRIRRGLVAVGLAFAVGYSFVLPVASLVHTPGWPSGSEVATVEQVLDQIPDGAEVTASNRLAPQLTNRCTVYLFPAFPRDGFHTPWVVLIENDISPLPPDRVPPALALIHQLGYHVVTSAAGVTLYHLTP